MLATGDVDMLEPQYQAYLQSYLDTLPPDAPQRMAPTAAGQFGDCPGAGRRAGRADRGAAPRRRHAGAVWAYEAEGSPLPTVGLLTVVLAGNNEPLCIIETTEVEIRPFNEVDAQFAYEEGEDERTLESWRREHWKFFSRVLPRDYGLQPAEDMPLVCERFRVVYPITVTWRCPIQPATASNRRGQRQATAPASATPPLRPCAIVTDRPRMVRGPKRKPPLHTRERGWYATLSDPRPCCSRCLPLPAAPRSGHSHRAAADPLRPACSPTPGAIVRRQPGELQLEPSRRTAPLRGAARRRPGRPAGPVALRRSHGRDDDAAQSRRARRQYRRHLGAVVAAGRPAAP